MSLQIFLPAENTFIKGLSGAILDQLQAGAYSDHDINHESSCKDRISWNQHIQRKSRDSFKCKWIIALMYPRLML